MLDEVALQIAIVAHEGQVRKGNGEPYVNHSKRVGDKLPSGVVRAGGYLHDVLEDSNDEELKKMVYRLPKAVVEIVELVTRKPGETYYQFIHRIAESGNEDAMWLKLTDLNDNLATLEEGSLKDKYRFAKTVIMGKL